MGEKLERLNPFDALYIPRPEFADHVGAILEKHDCLLVGTPGSGKTRFINEFTEQCKNCLVVRFSENDYKYLWSAPTGESLHSVFALALIAKLHDAADEKETCASLASSLDSYERILKRKKDPNTLEQIGEIGKRLHDKAPESIIPIVIFDDFDKLANKLAPVRLSAFLEALLVLKGESSERIKLLFTSAIWPDDQWLRFVSRRGRREAGVPEELDEQLKRLSADSEVVLLPLLTREQTRQLVEKGLSLIKEKLNSENISEQFDDIASLLRDFLPRIQELSDGHPLLIKKFYHYLLAKCDETTLTVNWSDVKNAIKEDRSVQYLIDRISRTMTDEQRQVLRLVSARLYGKLPHEFKRLDIRPDMLPPQIKIGRSIINSAEELTTLAKVGLLVTIPTDEQRQLGANLLWVDKQAYLRNAELVWEAFGEEAKALRSLYSAKERFAYWLVVHHPDWPLIQVLYYSVLVSFGLWILSGLTHLKIFEWISWFVLIPFLIYLLWTFIYKVLRQRRE